MFKEFTKTGLFLFDDRIIEISKFILVISEEGGGGCGIT